MLHARDATAVHAAAARRRRQAYLHGRQDLIIGGIGPQWPSSPSGTCSYVCDVTVSSTSRML